MASKKWDTVKKVMDSPISPVVFVIAALVIGLIGGCLDKKDSKALNNYVPGTQSKIEIDITYGSTRMMDLNSVRYTDQVVIVDTIKSQGWTLSCCDRGVFWFHKVVNTQ